MGEEGEGEGRGKRGGGMGAVIGEGWDVARRWDGMGWGEGGGLDGSRWMSGLSSTAQGSVPRSLVGTLVRACDGGLRCYFRVETWVDMCKDTTCARSLPARLHQSSQLPPDVPPP